MWWWPYPEKLNLENKKSGIPDTSGRFLSMNNILLTKCWYFLAILYKNLQMADLEIGRVSPEKNTCSNLLVGINLSWLFMSVSYFTHSVSFNFLSWPGYSVSFLDLQLAGEFLIHALLAHGASIHSCSTNGHYYTTGTTMWLSTWWR